MEGGKAKKHLRILDEADIASAQALLEELDPWLKRRVMAVVHRAIHTIDSYAKYVDRRLIRDGIYCDYSSNIIPLPDGFRIVIEMRLYAVDKDIVKKHWRALYQGAYDYRGPAHEFKKAFDRLIEGEVDVGGDEAGSSEANISEAGGEKQEG